MIEALLESHIIFGKSSGFNDIDLNSLVLDGLNGFKVVGEDIFDDSGWSVVRWRCE